MAEWLMAEIPELERQRERTQGWGGMVIYRGGARRKEHPSPQPPPGLPESSVAQCENRGTSPLLVSTGFELEHSNESSWEKPLANWKVI